MSKNAEHLDFLMFRLLQQLLLTILRELASGCRIRNNSQRLVGEVL